MSDFTTRVALFGVSVEKQVFISYSRKDEAFAERLATSLTNVDIPVWIDREDIRAGEAWSDEIQRGLDESQIMLLILSPDSMASHNVSQEWKYFLVDQKPIIPVMLVKPEKIHFQIRPLQFVDFQQDYDAAFKQLYNELMRHMGDTPAPVVAPQVSTPQSSPVPPMIDPLELEEDNTAYPDLNLIEPKPARVVPRWLRSTVVIGGVLLVIALLISALPGLTTALTEGNDLIRILTIIFAIVASVTVLSFLITQVLTIGSNVLFLRAKVLKQGLEDLVTDPATRARFLAHPLIRLVQVSLDPDRPLSSQAAQRVAFQARLNNVSWIDPRLFADTLMDVLSVDSDPYQSLQAAALEMLQGRSYQNVRQAIIRLQTGQISLADLRDVVEQNADPKTDEFLFNALSNFEDRYQMGEVGALMEATHRIEEPAFQRALQAQWRNIRSLEDARMKLERWFDSHMDSTTDRYRRIIHYWGLVVAVILALLLNIDALQMATAIWNAPATQTLIDQTLEENTSTPDTTPEQETGLEVSTQRAVGVETLAQMLVPIGWEYTPVSLLDSFSGASGERLQQSALDSSRNLWNFLPGNNPNWFSLIIRKIIGIALIVLAVSELTPLLFDSLRRLSR